MQVLIRNAGFTLLALSASCGVGVHAQTLETRIGPITMEGQLPSHSEIAKLYGELDFQQATQSFLWALPLVSYAQWQDEFSTKLGARSGDLMVLNTYEDKLGVITANATTPYILGFVDLNETGPLVIELPPGPHRRRHWRLLATGNHRHGPDRPGPRQGRQVPGPATGSRTTG